MNHKYTIGSVSKKTGLSSNLIRMWELRYSAVVPSRSPTNRRQYTDSDIEKLTMLKKAVDTGMSIGSVAGLSNDQLSTLLQGSNTFETSNQPESQFDKKEHQSYEYHLGNCFECVEKYDSDALNQVLGRAALYLNDNDLIKSVMKPFLLRVRELSKRGILNKLQETIAFDVTKGFLINLIDSFENLPRENKVLILQINQELNELSSLIAGAIFDLKGYEVIFVEFNSNIDSLKQSISHIKPNLVVLSNIFPEESSLIAEKSIEIDQVVQVLNDTRLLILNKEFRNQKDIFLKT